MKQKYIFIGKQLFFLFFVFKEVATLKLKYMIQNILAPSS